MATGPLTGRRFVTFVDDMYEELELWYPKLRLNEAGAQVIIAGPKPKHRYIGKHGYPCLAEEPIAELKPDQFDGVLCPGGFSPDMLRRDPLVLEVVRTCAEEGKLVAAICHGGWILISAGVCRGVRMTGSRGIRDDLVNAGALWQDAPVVVDRNFVTSRKPDDLAAHCRGILQFLGAAAFEEEPLGLTV